MALAAVLHSRLSLPLPKNFLHPVSTAEEDSATVSPTCKNARRSSRGQSPSGSTIRNLEPRKPITQCWSPFRPLVGLPLQVQGLLKDILVEFWRSHWLLKLYTFELHNSITHHLHIVLCDRHPKSSLLLTLFTPVHSATCSHPVPSANHYCLCL